MKTLLITVFSALILLGGCAGKSAIHSAVAEGDIKAVANYADKGGDLEALPPKNWVSGLYALGGNRPLHEAAARGSLQMAALLIARGANLESHNAKGETPLLTSARFGRFEMYDLLLQKGADRHATDKDGNTGLHLALEALGKEPAKAEEAVRFFLARSAKVDAQNRWGNTPVHLAAKHDLIGAVKLLEQKGALLDVPNRYGETPLFLTLRMGHFGHLDQVNLTSAVFEYLLTKKLNFAAVDHKGETLLHHTCNPDYIAALGAKGADINHADKDGQTAVFKALADCPLPSVQAYAKLGFNPKALGAKGKNVGKTALAVAMNNPYSNEAIVPFLIDYGADVLQTDDLGLSAIHAAATRSRTMIELILSKGADINARTHSDATPLHVASSILAAKSQEETEGYAALLEQPGILIDARDKKGCTPLHRAVNAGGVERVRLLLQKGADTTAQEMRGHTPMDLAILKKNEAVLALLKAHNAPVNINPKPGYAVLCTYP